MVAPPPHWKIGRIGPPPPLENPIPSRGGGGVGGYGYFLEPHIVRKKAVVVPGVPSGDHGNWE